MRQFPSLIGQKYGMLTVIEQASSTADGQRRWLCRCECGTEKIIMGSNLKRGTTVSCGCKKRSNLTGQKFGRLTVLERSDRYGSRGSRKVPLWKCRCECGAITYKATDTLTNPDVSMCRSCAGNFGSQTARAHAGFESGTQLSKIRNIPETSDNLSGIRGVYYDPKSGKYRARIKFQGKSHHLGTFLRLEDAIKARRQAEEDIFGKFLSSREENS